MNRKYSSLFQKKGIQSISFESEIGLEANKLNRTLSLRDLTSMGIAAVVGAGIFSTIGNASAAGGPAVSVLFIFTAVACLFSALCYAEFASGIPFAGSAYTYAYVSFGEIIAWIIGWDLLMEYAIGNIAVAISWSDYFTSLLTGLNIPFPSYLTMDYLSGHRAYIQVYEGLMKGGSPSTFSHVQLELYKAYVSAPSVFGVKLIFDLPALGITFLITWLVYIGIKESKNIGNILVAIKLVVILLVIAVGAFYVSPANWIPFAPNGLSGVLKGVSSVFFAYIGFDAISTTAEECKNPKEDLPKSMFYSLGICTILYVLITLVLTGMVKYSKLGVGDPLAFVFQEKGLDILSGIISISAIVAMTSVLLVFQLGQPRIWLSMSRDGLLPPVFARIHPKFKTPSFSTIVTGFVVAIPAMFMNLTEVTDLCSIGTLFAFIVVCGGILVKPKDEGRGFKVPYINGKYIVATLVVSGLLITSLFFKGFFANIFNDLFSMDFKHILTTLFLLFCVAIAVLSYIKSLSLIPVLGLIINLYLMTELGITNWLRFLFWLAIGLLVYFLYGKSHSLINKTKEK
ncbi:MAG TPA: amino acid permease [Cytophagaceae bacterium]|jgi:amino acid transporter